MLLFVSLYVVYITVFCCAHCFRPYFKIRGVVQNHKLLNNYACTIYSTVNYKQMVKGHFLAFYFTSGFQCNVHCLNYKTWSKCPVLYFLYFGVHVWKRLCSKSAGEARGSLLMEATGTIKMTADPSRIKVPCCGGHTVSSPLQLCPLIASLLTFPLQLTQHSLSYSAF